MHEAMGEAAYRGKPPCLTPAVAETLKRSKEVVQRASVRAMDLIRSRARATLENGTSPERKLPRIKQLLNAVFTVGDEMDYLARKPELENAILLLTREHREELLAELKQTVERLTPE